VNDLLDEVRKGNMRAVARLITAVENDAAAARKATLNLYKFTGNAHVIGVTGPPGCGKSTLVNEMALGLHSNGRSVGIIAVDPSSPFTGGALLGDRVRMADIAIHTDIFVRSMASRGNLGGLAEATSTAIKILDAAGFDHILVETVGAGQAEVDIASVAHTVLVIEAPDSGDEVQTIKAGILEIADILVVNKADRPAAARTVRALEMMLHLGRTNRSGHHRQPPVSRQQEAASAPDSTVSWDVPVLETIAIEGKGIDELLHKVADHKQYLVDSGEWFERELRRSRREIERLLQNQIILRTLQNVLPEKRSQVETAVAKREMDPYTAAYQLFDLASRYPS
jgi:LAO/AO transport system kinase